jgi:hypothetical protein
MISFVRDDILGQLFKHMSMCYYVFSLSVNHLT